MRLYMHETGPLLEYRKGMLHVEDLNPHVQTRWCMSRLEMLKTGLRFMLAAISRREG